ncbi:putative porin [Winogradskyella sp. 3972H.M.0a.05]|uniref:putative porin n=1 Tax=Winogradskyella sp. 3972H.M.0a.05 TaxID=2950277 RepID=UPI003399048A
MSKCLSWNRLIFFFITVLISSSTFSQQLKKVKQKPSPNDTISNLTNRRGKSNVKKNLKAKITDYTIFKPKGDTIVLDTSLTIKKEYKFNYLRKDNFNHIQFSNIGQTYNTLSHNFNHNGSMPLFGARARHFNYMEVEDINYYRVATPLTELFFKTAFEQGQVLDAFFTVNTSKNLNFSIAYKGLRSLGKYQNILTSTGNFRFTSNFTTKNNKYRLNTHMVTQDLLNQENGGLTDEDIINFESGNEEFLDRSVFDPNFQNAENILEGKRFYINHVYDIKRKKDSLSNSRLSIRNITSLEDKFYQYDQTAAVESFFGSAFSNVINDRVTLEDFNTSLHLEYSNLDLGTITAGVNYNNFNYGYDKLIILNNNIITNRLKGDNITFLGSYNNKFNKLSLSANGAINISGDFDGYNFESSLAYILNEDNRFQVGLDINSSLPTYNKLLYQSDYLNYNWDNSNMFDNVLTSKLSFLADSKKFGSVELDYTTINNHTYFSNQDFTIDNTNIKPQQYGDKINYFRVKINKEFTVGKFALDNTILYQKVIDGEEVLNTPDIITRNTLYYSNHLFKKAMFLQTGVTLNYFTEYYMDAYNPLLAEFYTQNQTKLGGFPRLDFFVNAKVRQTRIYFKLEHFNSAWTGYNYYTSPNYPYRDFAIRFGLVWNFFL